MLSRVLLVALGALLVLGGLAILLSSGVSLPTRSPDIRFRFSGVSLFLLGATPVVVGGTCFTIAVKALSPRSRVTQLLLGAGIAMLGLSFVLAPKGSGQLAHAAHSFIVESTIRISG